MKIEVVRVRPLVRAPLLLRLRYRWLRFRLGKSGRAIADEIAAAEERAFLFGE